ncbi:MAG: amino acid adenylation domain-containing protein, partial [bacterium]|nr:amino acid adenylation domain-containing protein [bacterium]
EHCAYVIYTSGSTGRPKGIAVSHRAVVNFLWSMAERPGLGAGDVLAAVTSPSFDIAVLELFLPLLAGARIELMTTAMAADGEALGQRLARSRATVMQATPATWRLLLEAGWEGDRRLRALCGGEAMPPALHKALGARVAAVWNLYGPTETTVWSTVARLAAGDRLTIGRPIANTAVHLLDRHLRPVPPGAVGELCIGGHGLARGYPGRPALSAEKFLPDPWSPAPGRRLYRTGDLARHLPDGGLDCLGRIDHQVKIRGFRIELGEVEAVLAEHPAVTAAAVVLVREDADDERLVAYLVRGRGPAEEAELRAHLERKLPAYMVPAVFVELEALPLTPNGKVDRAALGRRALPAPTAEEQPPQSELEKAVAAVWADVLGRETVGMHGNFFDLGGHSLLVSRAVNRLRTVLGREISVVDVFEHPTVASLARALAPQPEPAPHLRHREPELAALPPADELPLSFAQQRLWFLDQYEAATVSYNLPFAVRIAGRPRVAALAAAVAELGRRHHSLRTVFRAVDGRPLQVIVPPPPLPLPVVDLEALPGPRREAESRRRLDAENRRPFDLTRAPLMRLVLLRLDVEDHLLGLSMHHIISDGWSMQVFVRELATLYEAFVNGEPSSLGEPVLQYADFARWQRRWLAGEVASEQLAYWKKQLADLPAALELPADRQRPAVRSPAGKTRLLRFSRPLSAAVHGLAQRLEATPFMTLLAAFLTLLGRYTRQHDVPVGSVTAGRNRRQLEDLIGFFANTLVLRGDLSGNPPFRELVGRVRELTLAAFAHQDLPFDQLVEVLQPQRDPGRTPLFQVAFALQDTVLEAVELPGLTLAPLAVDTGTAKFDLTVMVWPQAGRLVGSIEYATALYDASTVVRLGRHFENLLTAVTARPEERISRLELLAPAERRQLVAEWNLTATPYPREKTVHELFTARAGRVPEAVAVVWEGGAMSFGELDRRSNRLARHLRRRGVEAETLVGLFVERSPEMVVAILAVLKAGGAYAPLDTGQPEARLALLLADARVPLVLTQERLAARLPAGTPVLRLDRDQAAIAGEPPVCPEPSLTAENLCYLMVTSGTTGTPKGIAVPHRGVVRLVRETDYAELGDQVFLQLAPLPFDASTLETWAPLVNGGRLVLYPPGPLSLDQLAAVLERHRITILFLTTALFLRMSESYASSLASLGQLITGGEIMSPAHMAAMLETLDGRLIHAYGPTENTTFTTCHPVRSCRLGIPVPIGRPIANTRIHLLDRHLEPVPVGVPGELCCAGDGLARGYHERPALTAAAFVPDPFSAEPGERLYKTGDLARYLADGAVDFVGRIDAQVKIRGFRIEPGEVETVLAAHPAVVETVVVVREDVTGDKRLVAYVVADGEPPAIGELQRFLAERLPPYMVPAAFVLLEELPLTPNGKVDHRALPAPEIRSDEDYTAPGTPTEELLASIWGKVLGVARVGIDDDFFALGGHSLLATRLVSAIRRAFAVELPLEELFNRPTVAALAGVVDTALGSGPEPLTPPLERVPRTPPPPASFAQQRLWFLAQLTPDNPAYNVPAAVAIRGPLAVAAFERSLDELVRRHEILRTRFVVDGDGPVQVIDPPAPQALPMIDLAALAPARRQAELERLAAAEAVRPFDLARGPLLRTTLVALEPAHHVFLLNQHHVVSDGWSVGVLIRELAALYQAFSGGRSSPLSELPVQYADFAVWQRRWLRGQVLADQLAWWREQLAGAASLELPADRPRPPQRSGRGRSTSFALSALVRERLEALSRDRGATLFMTLTAAFQILLHRYSGQRDVVVGTPIAGRRWAEIEELIGFFVNTLVLRADVSPADSFASLLARTRAVALAAYAHQDVPFEQLVEELQPRRDRSRTPLFQVLFALQNAPLEPLELPQLSLEPLAVEGRTAKFDLNLSLSPAPAGLAGSIEYATDLFDRTSVARMSRHFEVLLEAVATEPGCAVADLGLLSPAEQQQLVGEWNDTARAWPQSTLTRLIEEQAATTPEAVAAVCEDRQLSYRELDRRADALARYLGSRGVGAEGLVGIRLERSLEMIVGLVGILKAGAAYVPLDPGYPAERIDFMIEDAGAEVVLTQKDLAGLGESGSGSGTGSGTGSEGLAYVIYTSGSTGQPKGAMSSHRAIVNRLRWMQEQYALTAADRVLQKTPFSFDVSVWEFFWPLLVGARLVFAKPGGHKDGAYLVRLIAEQAITTLHFVPSMLAAFLEEPEAGSCCTLKRVICSGEALPFDLQRRFFSRLGAELHNLYGPTEAAVDVTFWDCRRDAGRPLVPIGRPLANTEIRILDRRLRPVPVGVAGELHIGGVQLARGYRRRRALTAERFIPGPFGERLYKTGDLARTLPDGNVEFLGRIDHQIKIRGFRIELGEIEAVLAGHPEVTDAVVAAREDVGAAAAAEKQLVAYLVAAGEKAPAAAELKRFLAEKLPDYMVPAAFVPLETLPLLANGKVDRRALPAPDLRAEKAYVAPTTPTEKTLVDIWAEVLGTTRTADRRIGIEDDFFELGGHSLMATQVAARIQAGFAIELPVSVLFETRVVRRLALTVEEMLVPQADEAPPRRRTVEERRAQLSAGKRALLEQWMRSKPAADAAPARIPRRPAPDPVARDQVLPLSFSQQRLWLLDQLEPGTPIYNLPSATSLEGPLDTTALARALATMVSRHESLRTTFAAAGGRPVQVVAPAGEAALPRVDLRALATPRRTAEIERLTAEDARRPFDLERGPLLRTTLLQFTATGHRLLINIHHICSDAWSMGIFVRELGALYKAHAAGAGDRPLAELPIQYADFAVWQRQELRGEKLEQLLAWWRRQLEGAPTALEPATDRPRPPLLSSRGATRYCVYPRSLADALEALSQRHGASAFMTLATAFMLLLHRHSGQRDLLVGTPIANRTRSELEGLIGFFVNTLVLRSDLRAAPDPTFSELLAQVRERALEAYAHQDLPFEKLVEELQPQRRRNRTPLFQAIFSHENAPVEIVELRELGLAELTLRPLDIDAGIAMFDLSLRLRQEPRGLWVAFEYSTDLFDASTIGRLTGHLESLLRGITAAPERRLSELPMLPAAQAQQLLVEWNDAGAAVPGDETIHQLCAAQAASTPDAIALTSAGEQLTYRQLERRAKRLAHQLRTLGVGPEVLVGLCLERSPELVVALLAILKAGGVFVPLDPSYPAERLAFMFGDTGMTVLLTHSRLRPRLPAHEVRTVCVDELDGAGAQLPPAIAVDPSTLRGNLAYVLYTSGSTGRPKGVAVAHGALARHCRTIVAELGLGAGDRVLVSASFSFDVALEQTLPALAAGARLVLAGRELWLPSELSVRLAELAVTVADLPAAYWQQWIADGAATAPAALRLVTVGGDVMPSAAACRWPQTALAGIGLVNAYGPTEATVTATVYRLPAGAQGCAWRVPIGRPLPGRCGYVVDRSGRPVAAGVAGELCLGGELLARGYLGRPALS